MIFLVPSDASSRRSTSGSIDYRKLRHSSFGQKLSEIFRRVGFFQIFIGFEDGFNLFFTVFLLIIVIFLH